MAFNCKLNEIASTHVYISRCGAKQMLSYAAIVSLRTIVQYGMIIECNTCFLITKCDALRQERALGATMVDALYSSLAGTPAS